MSLAVAALISIVAPLEDRCAASQATRSFGESRAAFVYSRHVVGSAGVFS